MTTVSWAIFCDRVELEDGKASLIGLFDAILVPKFPTVHHRLTLAASITVSPMEKVEFGGVVRNPAGDIIATVNEPGFTARGDILHKCVFTFDNLPFLQPGKYQFEILLNGKVIHRAPLPVSLMAVN